MAHSGPSFKEHSIEWTSLKRGHKFFTTSTGTMNACNAPSHQRPPLPTRTKLFGRRGVHIRGRLLYGEKECGNRPTEGVNDSALCRESPTPVFLVHSLASSEWEPTRAVYKFSNFINSSGCLRVIEKDVL